jgi:hypothetical protein
MTFETAEMERRESGYVLRFQGTSFPQPLPGASSRPFSENFS